MSERKKKDAAVMGFATGIVVATALWVGVFVVFDPTARQVLIDCETYGAATASLPGRDLVIRCQPISDDAYDAKMKALAREP